jgi:hypothetical protein
VKVGGDTQSSIIFIVIIIIITTTTTIIIITIIIITTTITTISTHVKQSALVRQIFVIPIPYVQVHLLGDAEEAVELGEVVQVS